MDYPKSVPGVGLVGGKFVDEDAATGRQGSLVPSAWGNSVTEELLEVIRAAGLEPNEARTDQLLESIRKLLPKRTVFARLVGTLAMPADVFGIYALADGGAAATVTLPSVEDLPSDTELLLFAAHANTKIVQIKSVVGQTIQGPASLMSGSAVAFALPEGGDWVRLRSEKAQLRWVVAGNFAVGERARIVSLEAIPKPIGYQQAWTDVLASRALGVNYTNDTGRTITVSVSLQASGSGASLSAFVNGNEISRGVYNYNGSAPTSIMFPVGPGKQYRVAIGGGTGSLVIWKEER